MTQLDRRQGSARSGREEQEGLAAKHAFLLIRLPYNIYCTVSTIVLLVTWMPEVVFVMVAVMFVVPAATLVAKPLPLPPLMPLPIVATLVFEEVQVTALVRFRLLDILA
jgi:hypothetical protein